MAIVENQMVEVKWNGANRKTYEQLGYSFTNSGDVFLVKIKHLSKGSHSEVKYTCDFCGNVFYRQRKKLNKPLNFCGHDCSCKFNAEKYKSEAPHIDCLYCGKNFRIKHYEKDTAKFCSRTCQGKWTSENRKGKNSPLYVERVILNCDWCNEKIERTPNMLKINDFHFCNKVCSEKWHKKIFIQNEEYKKNMKKVMIDNLTSGKIKTTETKPHLKINNILDKLQINYINEYDIKHYSVDIYLPDHDLFIEVNGGYWHCDNRFFENVETVQQVKRIRTDKSKLGYIKNKYGKHPLYLWEYDIKQNEELCIQLINAFIHSKGEILNYHSFNYTCEDRSLKLNDKIIVPYMELSADDLNRIINITTKKKISKIQPDKHITFSCDNCGKEATNYRSKYVKSKTHCCSIQCTNEYRKIR